MTFFIQPFLRATIVSVMLAAAVPVHAELPPEQQQKEFAALFQK
jgi:hypothetical protein